MNTSRDRCVPGLCRQITTTDGIGSSNVSRKTHQHYGCIEYTTTCIAYNKTISL